MDIISHLHFKMYIHHHGMQNLAYKLKFTKCIIKLWAYKKWENTTIVEGTERSEAVWIHPND